MADLSTKVSEALRGLNLLDPDIQVQTLSGSVFATVVSESFADMDEADRQALVWKALREKLTEHEHIAVEFVFTFAPAEQTNETEEIPQLEPN